MANTACTHSQPGPAADNSNDNSEGLASPIDFPSNAVTINTTSTKEVTHLRPYQAPDSPKTGNPPFAMQRYLDETPRAGGPTCGLVYRPGHQDILNALALVDFEFGEEKKPN